MTLSRNFDQGSRLEFGGSRTILAQRWGWLVVEVGIALAILSLPLYWIGFDSGRAPILGVALAFWLGAGLTFWVSWRLLPASHRAQFVRLRGCLVSFLLPALGALMAYMCWTASEITDLLALIPDDRSVPFFQDFATFSPIIFVALFASALVPIQLSLVNAATWQLKITLGDSLTDHQRATRSSIRELLPYAGPVLLASPLALWAPLTLPVLILAIVQLIRGQNRMVQNGFAVSR